MLTEEEIKSKYDKLMGEAFGARAKGKEDDFLIRLVGWLYTLDDGMKEKFKGRAKSLAKHLLRKGVEFDRLFSEEGEKRYRREICRRPFTDFRYGAYGLRSEVKEALNGNTDESLQACREIKKKAGLLSEEFEIWAEGKTEKDQGKIQEVKGILSDEVLSAIKAVEFWGLPYNPQWSIEIIGRDAYYGLLGKQIPEDTGKAGDDEAPLGWLIFLSGKSPDERLPVLLYKYEDGEGRFPIADFEPVDSYFDRLYPYRRAAAKAVVGHLRTEGFMSSTGYQGKFVLAVKSPLDKRDLSELRLETLNSGLPLNLGELRRITYGGLFCPDVHVRKPPARQGQIYIPNKGEVAEYFKNR